MDVLTKAVSHGMNEEWQMDEVKCKMYFKVNVENKEDQ